MTKVLTKRLAREKEETDSSDSSKRAKIEISGLKKIIYAHCLGILPTLRLVAESFNVNPEFVEAYKKARGQELCLSDLADDKKGPIVKFAYPIRLHEDSVRSESGRVVSLKSGARLGIDVIDGNGFVPSLIYENDSKPFVKHYVDYSFIEGFLHKELNPDISELGFLKEIVRHLDYWDGHERFDAEERITKRFQEKYLELKKHLDIT
jgi:hypothetical protein